LGKPALFPRVAASQGRLPVRRLSIVIPWIGPAEQLEDTLATVLQNRPSGCDVLVALAEPYNDPYGVADEVTFVPPPARKDNNFVALVNRAVTQAEAPVVHVLACGVRVTEDWTSAALLHFDDASIAAVAPAMVSAQNPERVVAAGVDFTAAGARQLAQQGRAYNLPELVKTRPLAAPLCGGFFRKSVLEALDGFDASLSPHAAELDFALCAAALDLRTECEPASVLECASAPIDNRFATGRSLERIFWRHATAEQRRERSKAHTMRLLGELGYAMIQPQWLGHAAGRAVGWLTGNFEHSPAARIATARERLSAEPQILRMPRATSSTSQSHRRAA
jgi:hypothetical protein